ncbi:MAG: S8 family serine peptidase [Bdellovibrionales bacterium]|nr:S8 family serine peptidase [Bdellovibrionales bacterium]
MGKKATLYLCLFFMSAICLGTGLSAAEISDQELVQDIEHEIKSLQRILSPLYDDSPAPSKKDSKAFDWNGWHLRGPQEEYFGKPEGINVTQAKTLPLKKRQEGQKKIIVAIIDSGFLEHEDYFHLFRKNPGETGVWETAMGDSIQCRSKECNGIDDDGNGFIDDVYGWNFVGKDKEGQPIEYDTTGVTREYDRLTSQGKNMRACYAEEVEPYDQRYCEYVEREWLESTKKYQAAYKELVNIKKKIARLKDSELRGSYDSYLDQKQEELSKALETESLRKKKINKDLYELNSTYRKSLSASLKDLENLFSRGFNPSFIPKRTANYEPNNFSIHAVYGNNDFHGSYLGHGTGVSGTFSTVPREMGSWAEDWVEIIPISVVPQGRERDRDVALGIRYAVNQGAKVISLSFGSKFSSEDRHYVFEAMKYAEDHDVLIVQAAGNDGQENTLLNRFPHPYETSELSSRKIASHIVVGGSGPKDKSFNDKNNVWSLACRDSSWGNMVDVLSPSIYIKTSYSTSKNAKGWKAGTSSGTPLVSAMLAIAKAQFPSLDAKTLKSALMDSARRHHDKEMYYLEVLNKMYGFYYGSSIEEQNRATENGDAVLHTVKFQDASQSGIVDLYRFLCELKKIDSGEAYAGCPEI